MSSQVDLEFHLGEDWLVDYTATDLGVAIDLTGATIYWRLSTITGTTVMTRTNVDGITITSATDGEFSLRVTPTNQTNASVAASTRYQYELKVELASGVETVQARGHVNVMPSLIT